MQTNKHTKIIIVNQFHQLLARQQLSGGLQAGNNPAARPRGPGHSPEPCRSRRPLGSAVLIKLARTDSTSQFKYVFVLFFFLNINEPFVPKTPQLWVNKCETERLGELPYV